MARLKSVVSGVVVSVSDETAALLGSEWEDADKAPRSESPDKSWKVADLKAYADENSIDLGDATKKEDVLAAITAHAGSGADA
jgi:hypothetical protein